MKAGERLNPHPSGDPKYDVEIVKDLGGGLVTVRYVSGGPSWRVRKGAALSWRVAVRSGGADK